MQKEIAFGKEQRRAFLKKFNEKYPQYETGIIGRSILSRDIDYYRIGSGRKSIIAVGAHHGAEYITAAALYDFIEFLCEKVARDMTWDRINLSFLLQKFTFWIIPCLNPDGVDMNLYGIEKTPLYERQIRMNGGNESFLGWQANARGVDLNHNYNHGFSEYKRIEEENGIYAGRTRFSGEYPESEPETKSLSNLIRVIMPCAVISFHSQGEEIFAKPKNERVLKLAERLASSVSYKLSVADGCAAYGGLSDYAGDVLGIPSFTVELGKGENPLPPSAFRGVCDVVRKLIISLPTKL